MKGILPGRVRPVDKTSIAKPCDEDWDKMTGDEQMRHCQRCRLNVYNLATRSEKEIYQLLREKEGRVCIKIYRRADGTLLTDECPVGLRAYRDRLKIVAASLLAWAVAAGLIQAAQAQGLVGAPVDATYGVPMCPEPVLKESAESGFKPFLALKYCAISLGFLSLIATVRSFDGKNLNAWARLSLIFLALLLPAALWFVFDLLDLKVIGH